MNPAGYSLTMSGVPDDENTLANPTRIIPAEGKFVAGESFDYQLPAWSVQVLRIHLTK
jgi:alpha-L-arabinofuranosidase